MATSFGGGGIAVFYKKIFFFFLALLPWDLMAEGIIDLDQLFKRQQEVTQQMKREEATPQLLVFISFSMPKSSLREWAEQINRVSGVLLLRGLHENSISKTTSHTMNIFDNNAMTEIKVDPESFRKFDIKAVPSVVVVSHHKNGSSFDKVAGDMSLETALEKIVDKGEDGAKESARVFLERYRKRKND